MTAILSVDARKYARVIEEIIPGNQSSHIFPSFEKYQAEEQNKMEYSDVEEDSDSGPNSGFQKEPPKGTK